MKKIFLFALFSPLFIACGGSETPAIVDVVDTLVAVLDEPLPTPVPADTVLKKTTIEFPSKDSLMITADVYEMGDRPWILLCHQARWSRGEYNENAKLLSEWGYNSMAIDQRSGGEVNGVKNETAARAAEQGLPTDYYNALQDIEAATDFLSKKAGGKIIICGSSYSSALVLKVANENENVRAVISFSPGEYYDGHTVADWPFKMEKPLFVTSAKNERTQTEEVLTMIMQKYVTYFMPEGEGEHGSRALWEEKADHKEYRNALFNWLTMIDQQE